MANLLDLLDLLLLLGIVLVNLLGLGLVVVALLLIIIGLLGVELDGETDELGVLLDKVLNALLLEVFGRVLLEVEDDASTTGAGVMVKDPPASEHQVSHSSSLFLEVTSTLAAKVGGVETNGELTDHGNVGAGGKGLH